MFSPDQPGPGNIVKTQKQTDSLSRHVMKAGETLYEIAEPSAAATADRNPKDPEPAPISLRRVLYSFTTAYSLFVSATTSGDSCWRWMIASSRTGNYSRTGRAGKAQTALERLGPITFSQRLCFYASKDLRLEDIEAPKV